MHRCSLIVLFIVVLLAARTALAQQAEPPAEQAADSATPYSDVEPVSSAQPAPDPAGPDVVRLKNGGMIRGVIQVQLPGQYVDIRTGSGEVHRFAVAEISYSGPDTAEPAAIHAEPTATPAISTELGLRTIHLESVRPGVTFYVDVPSPESLTTLCTAPCTAALPEGATRLALSVEGRKPALAERIEIDAGKTYYGDFHSKRGVRIAGGVILLAALATAIPLVIVGAQGSSICTSTSSFSGGGTTSCRDETEPFFLTSGLVIGIGGATTGLIMLFRKDRAIVWPGS